MVSVRRHHRVVARQRALHTHHHRFLAVVQVAKSSYKFAFIQRICGYFQSSHQVRLREHLDDFFLRRFHHLRRRRIDVVRDELHRDFDVQQIFFSSVFDRRRRHKLYRARRREDVVAAMMRQRHATTTRRRRRRRRRFSEKRSSRRRAQKPRHDDGGAFVVCNLKEMREEKARSKMTLFCCMGSSKAIKKTRLFAKKKIHSRVGV